MLSRPGPLPSGSGWTYEVKWDGFRAIVSTEDGFRVRSRRRWNMTTVLPELRGLPQGLLLDGELVAWNRMGEPHFPLICRRVLNDDRSVALTYMVFDVLRIERESVMDKPLAERRKLLERLRLDGPAWMTPDAFADGRELYAAVCERGLEGVVAKWRKAPYRPGEHGWVKVKNPHYWRRDWEWKSMKRSAERRANSRPAHFFQA
jgi:bifunctional non-homologous end joining protein LigD